ncbi:guanylate kinase [Patescibacteria group bacterium]|nr:guanylate kinase [Patescibacteria group bacterium]
MTSSPAPLFILIGPSGVGKTTVLERLLQDTDLSVVRFLTTTSRQPREGEKTGLNYHFVSEQAFQELIQEERLFEWVNIYGHFYGTQKDRLSELRQGNIPIICILELEGARKIKELDPEHTLVILLSASRATLIERLKARHGTAEELDKRIARIDQELHTYPSLADVTVDNEDGAFEQTVETIKQIIRTVIK